MIALYSILTSSKEKYSNYSAKLSRSPLSNLLLFALGLSIVDMPGLFNFVFWEYLVHHTATIAPYMVIKGFSVLSLNTLLVFLFYFSNFLGFPEHKVQVRHHYKHDTLHLRWVQKHTCCGILRMQSNSKHFITLIPEGFRNRLTHKYKCDFFSYSFDFTGMDMKVIMIHVSTTITFEYFCRSAYISMINCICEETPLIKYVIDNTKYV